MIITCIADLHGHYPELEGGDLLIVAGDLTARDIPDQSGCGCCDRGMEDVTHWVPEPEKPS